MNEPFEQEQSEDTERHATNLELFLDLVFVFAVTQVASLHPGHRRRQLYNDVS